MHPKYSSTFTMVNLLLGAGPLILPYAFFQGGLILSTIWMLFIAFISYNSAMYIAQSMSKVTYLDQNNNNNSSSPYFQSIRQNQQSIITTQNNQSNHHPAAPQQTQTTPLIINQRQKKYDHMQQFAVLYGEKSRIYPCLAICIYLTGTAISKCIMTGNVLSKVFNEVYLLEEFNFWLGLFFVSGAAFSFKSIESTKGLQFLIIIVRFVSILLMLFGAVYVMIEYGIKTPTPKDQGYFNISNFTQIFSNSLFALLCHHSIPGIAHQVKNTADTSFFIKVSFSISSIILLIIPLSACFAFGDDLGSHKYIYYNFDFDMDSTRYIYYIVSFYVFLNIAAFSVYIIVIRTNLLKVLKPQVNPMRLSKQTIFMTVVLLGVILIVSVALQEYIQYVLDFTGGIFGSIILFFIPAIQVYKARKMVYREGEVKNYMEKFPLVIMILGGLFMGFNLFQVIQKLIRKFG